MTFAARHLGVLVVVALVACREPAAPDPLTQNVLELLSKTEGEPALSITLGEYRSAAARLRFSIDESLYAKPLSEELRTHLIEQMRDDLLLEREAQRLKVGVSTTAVARELASSLEVYDPTNLKRRLNDTYQTKADLTRAIERRLVRTALLQSQAFKGLRVDDEALKKAWLVEPPGSRIFPARLHARQIVLATEDEATKVHRTLKRGADFSILAKALSIAPEAPKGGDLGWFSAGQMPEVFDTMCGPLEVGQLSEVTPSPFGFHICKVLQKQPERPLTFEEMKDKLRALKFTDKKRKAEAKYMAKLLNRYTVVKHPERLKLKD